MKSHPLANILRRGGFFIGLAAMLVVAAGGAGMPLPCPIPVADCTPSHLSGCSTPEAVSERRRRRSDRSPLSTWT